MSLKLLISFLFITSAFADSECGNGDNMFSCKKENKRDDVKRKPRDMYPFAKWNPQLPLFKTINDFKFDEDHYFVLHHLAGQPDTTGKGFAKYFLKEGLCTFFIDREGQVWQQHDSDRVGWHTGNAEWDGKQLNKISAGVEVASAGKLTKRSDGLYESWFGDTYNEEEVRECTGGCVVPGFYHKFTQEQEASIAKLMGWHVYKGLPDTNIVGHDQIRIPYGYKNDPGSSISKPLHQFIREDVWDAIDFWEEYYGKSE